MLDQYEDLLQRSSEVLGNKVTASGLVGELKLRGDTGIDLARKVMRQSRGRHAVAHPAPGLQDAVLKVLATPLVEETKSQIENQTCAAQELGKVEVKCAALAAEVELLTRTLQSSRRESTTSGSASIAGESGTSIADHS